MRNIIEQIETKTDTFDGFHMLPIPKYGSFHIGLDRDKNLVFTIKANEKSDPVNFVSSKGKYLDVLFDTECEISSDGKILTDKFTVLLLKSNNIFFKKIFLSVCEDLIEMLGDKPYLTDVVNHVEVFRDIFGKATKKGKISEIGLWGELLIIESCSDIKLMIDSWHKYPKQTFDFNDGNTKFEVKTTTLNERIHSFSHNQLLKAKSSSSLVCSVMTSEIDLGLTVSDLFDLINSKIDHSYRIKLKEKILDCAGDDIEKFKNKFDYKSAILAMKLFSANEIPCIDLNAIPPEITDVKFQVKLEGVSEYLINSNSPNLIKIINH